eukprot:7183709-Pyramimonas_sp.AAC.1
MTARVHDRVYGRKYGRVGSYHRGSALRAPAGVPPVVASRFSFSGAVLCRCGADQGADAVRVHAAAKEQARVPLPARGELRGRHPPTRVHHHGARALH